MCLPNCIQAKTKFPKDQSAKHWHYFEIPIIEKKESQSYSNRTPKLWLEYLRQRAQTVVVCVNVAESFLFQTEVKSTQETSNSIKTSHDFSPSCKHLYKWPFIVKSSLEVTPFLTAPYPPGPTWRHGQRDGTNSHTARVLSTRGFVVWQREDKHHSVHVWL